MSSEWARLRIQDLGRVVTGKTPPTSNEHFFGGGIPFLTPTDMVDGEMAVSTSRTLTAEGLASVKNCLVPRGVAVSCIGWQMGKSVLVLQPTVTNQQINTVVVDEVRFDLRFVYYLLSSMRRKIFELGATPTRTPIVNKTTFSQMAISVPPLSEQRNIAECLSVLDDRITLLRDTNTTLVAIAQALFKSWFVDFDPVRAKQEGRAPEGMDAATAALFPDRFDESECGPVPKGWKVGRFSDVLEEANARIGKRDAFVLSAIQTGHLVRSDQHFTKRVHSEDISKYKAVNPNAFAYNPSRINIGSIGLNEFGSLGAVSPIYVVLEPISEASGYLIWHHLRTRRVTEAIQILCSGTVRQSLSSKDFCSLPLTLPSEQALSAFHEIRNRIYGLYQSNLERCATLESIRDTLLPRLISSQLRLPEAEALAA